MAATLDLVFSLFFAVFVFTSTCVGVLVVAMVVWQIPLPTLLSDLGPDALAFWAFELLVFTPFGWLALIEGVVIGVMCRRARRGLLAARSPGMLLTGIAAPASRKIAS
jgi:hypothetical protein